MNSPFFIYHSKPTCHQPFVSAFLFLFTLVLAFFLNIHLPALCAVPQPPDDKGQAEAENESKKAQANLLLQGEVERDQYSELEKKVNELFKVAIERDNDTEFLKNKNNHFNKIFSRAWAGTKDIAELATEYKGFEQSSEAGDIILGEKLKIKSKASADYASQIKRDRLETDIFLALMLMAEGLGTADQADKDELVAKSLSSLDCLVGKDQAQNTLKLMQDSISSTSTDTRFSARKPWNSLETAKQTKTVLAKAIEGDDAISDIKTVVHKKYNQRSALARACAKILNASLSIGGLTPTIIGTASQCAWTVYIATQGGPEESKLLKEVYLAKGLESRCKCLSEYAALAVNSHNIAITTRNPAMLSFSDWMINRVCKSDSSDKLAIAKSKLDEDNSTDTSVIEIDSAYAPVLEASSASKVAHVTTSSQSSDLP